MSGKETIELKKLDKRTNSRNNYKRGTGCIEIYIESKSSYISGFKMMNINTMHQGKRRDLISPFLLKSIDKIKNMEDNNIVFNTNAGRIEI